MNCRRPPRTPAEVARRAENARHKAERDGAPTTRKTSRATKAPTVSPAAARILEVAGVLVVGKLVTVRPGLVRVEIPPPLALPRSRRVECPSWLEVVRAMPCSVCGMGRSFRDSLLAVASVGWKGVRQSEPNHHPARGPSGGGSDLETHPACRRCHRGLTDHPGVISIGTRDRYVADTLLAIMRAIRDGYLHPSILIAAGTESIIGD